MKIRPGHGVPPIQHDVFLDDVIAFCMLVTAFFVPVARPISGRTAYAPLSE
jgi:hypothetical protein